MRKKGREEKGWTGEAKLIINYRTRDVSLGIAQVARLYALKNRAVNVMKREILHTSVSFENIRSSFKNIEAENICI